MKSLQFQILLLFLLIVSAGAVSQSLIATDSAKLAGIAPTAAGLALLDDADAAEQLGTLGLGSSDDVTFGSVAVDNHAYQSDWNGDAKVPTRNALYNKIEQLQPRDADLDALAALTGTNDSAAVRTAADTWESTTLKSGTYTPTLTNGSNAPTFTAYKCQYIRVGNVVTVSGKVDVTPSMQIATVLRIQLPVASNIGTAADCQGVGADTQNYNANASPIVIVGDATNDSASMRWTSTGFASRTISFTFTYEVL